jgi:type IV secretion system protein VirB9
MKTVGLALLLSTVLSGTPWAIETPRPGARDPNIRTQAYRSDSRVMIVGTMRRSTTITFGTDESVVRVIFGDDEIWDAPDGTTLGNTPLKNHLPLWPKKPGRTNLQVITSRPGQPDRIYQFTTIVRDTPENGEDDPEATYGLTFLYNVRENAPPRATPSPVAPIAARERESEERAAQSRLREDRLPAELPGRHVSTTSVVNYRYAARGDRSIEPFVWDDGERTYITLKRTGALPAIFIVGADGTEQAISFTVALTTFGGRTTDLLIIDRVVRRMRFRQGGSVLSIVNLGFNPENNGRGSTGTRRPDVRRELR